MKNFFLIFTVLKLVFFTTLIKNSTKKLDIKIFETKENILHLEEKYKLVLLDYSYLSSPSKLMRFRKDYFDEEFEEF